MVDQLTEAGILLGVGMSVVFTFLTLLIAGIHAIAWFCRTFPSPEQTQNIRPQQTQNNNKKASSTVSPEIAAAITAAVHTHRHTTSK
jgi:oxaloacetate decarboxylase gamma subunit